MSTSQIERISRVYRFWPFWSLGTVPYFQKPREAPTARLTPWQHTAEQAYFDEMRAVLNPNRGGRFVPVGDYVKLSVFSENQNDDDYDYDHGPHWRTVMSDTPDEFNDHAEALIHGRGRVLIHGLGLGCVLNVLANKKNVTHIDVVEANPDVAQLVMPYFQRYGDLIEFHIGSCVDIKWPAGTRWNYVWHDIWSTIAVENLTDKDDPEHGISYERLHRKFAHRCDQQGSWAFDLAKKLRRRNQIADKWLADFVSLWNSATFDERYHLATNIASGALLDGVDYRKMLEQDNQLARDMRDRMYSICGKKMDLSYARMFAGDDAQRYAMRKQR